jgi:hypothetical protein
MTADKELRDAIGRPALKFLDEWVRRQFRGELQELQPRLIGFKRAFEALIDETLPEDWWTFPNEVQLRHLRRECSFAAEADLGKSLKPGIGDQVRFGEIKREDQESLVQQINAVEHDEIRRKRGLGEADDMINAKALAFSGGGIRSATCCLDVTQVLARRGLLHQFDYLSTLSGGGYFGSFLSTFLGTGERITSATGDDKAEVNARINETFWSGSAGDPARRGKGNSTGDLRGRGRAATRAAAVAAPPEAEPLSRRWRFCSEDTRHWHGSSWRSF